MCELIARRLNDWLSTRAGLMRFGSTARRESQHLLRAGFPPTVDTTNYQSVRRHSGAVAAAAAVAVAAAAAHRSVGATDTASWRSEQRSVLVPFRRTYTTCALRPSARASRGASAATGRRRGRIAD